MSLLLIVEGHHFISKLSDLNLHKPIALAYVPFTSIASGLINRSSTIWFVVCT